MENTLFPFISTISQIFTTGRNFGFGRAKQPGLLTAVSHPTPKITFVTRKGERGASSRFILYTTDVVMLRASRSPLTNRYRATNKSQPGSEMTRIEVSKDLTLVMQWDLPG